MYKLKSVADFRTVDEAMEVIKASAECEHHINLPGHSCETCILFNRDSPCTYITAKARVYLWETHGIIE